MGLSFFLSKQTGSILPMPDIPNIDKLAHFLIYALLAVAVLYNPSSPAAVSVAGTSWPTR